MLREYSDSAVCARYAASCAGSVPAATGASIAATEDVMSRMLYGVLCWLPSCTLKLSTKRGPAVPAAAALASRKRNKSQRAMLVSSRAHRRSRDGTAARTGCR